ncbi:hypothetical protein BC938DRAFT_474820 [Jimgerdemannia flammicorona]|uniref:Uncharacterized protein n=1 Tax=Jimgerdemannia flammicorona TaxID=994334 RepID=A0A433Q1H5_9FUNG|nr:hypothetical protein BC938DRAFT_474820 [Jimgerdemannia flammicorona]
MAPPQFLPNKDNKPNSSPTNLVDVFALQTGEQRFETLVVSLDTDGGEDLLDVLGGGVRVATEGEEQVSREMLHGDGTGVADGVRYELPMDEPCQRLYGYRYYATRWMSVHPSIHPFISIVHPHAPTLLVRRERLDSCVVKLFNSSREAQYAQHECVVSGKEGVSTTCHSCTFYIVAGDVTGFSNIFRHTNKINGFPSLPAQHDRMPPENH